MDYIEIKIFFEHLYAYEPMRSIASDSGDEKRIIAANVALFSVHLSTENDFAVSSKGLTHSHTMTPFDAPGKEAF